METTDTWMAECMKVTIEYDKDWWREKGLSGGSQS